MLRAYSWKKILDGVAVLGLMAVFLLQPGCASAPKKKPIYSYELPWSGTVIHSTTVQKLPKNDLFDGNKRLDAYLEARKASEMILLDEIRKLHLTEKETVGDAIDRKPIVLKRIRRFVEHAKVENVAYLPGEGIRVQESAYLGADFQSLLGVTLHLMPRKKKKVLGPDSSKPGGGASSGAGGMPMMPMMP
ncbi:MAG: hypothetical protein ACYCTV_00690 [Leptospirales bacterium]